MSRHVSRKQRWKQESTKAYSSPFGVVRYEERAWFGTLAYRTRAPQPEPGGLAQWVPQTLRLGPFKRPRDAMVAVEREAAFLRNRHGEALLFGDEVWGERAALGPE
jgi:hypothetical protein